MDQRAVKRPRGGESGPDSKKPPKKKQKKSKTKKQNNTDSSEKKETTAHAALESTATAEGVTMTQMLSTFNRVEQSRFEAFRRSTFRGDAIEGFVAHCLAARDERRTQNCGKKRSLQDMVAPGQADEITSVVSTLAKAHAQRLVTAARRVATAEDHPGAILPQHLLEAYNSRVQAGLDPGFFLQASPVGTSGGTTTKAQAAALGISNQNELQWNAALAAQEDYDKYMATKNSDDAVMKDADEAVENKEEGTKDTEKSDASAKKDEDITMKEVDSTDASVSKTTAAKVETGDSAGAATAT